MKESYQQGRKFVVVCLALLVAALFSGTAAHAQTAGAGTINGTLTDASGAVVQDAEVIVKNEDTGLERKLSTNDAGLYVAPFLQPGHYSVVATKAGFATVERKNIALQVGQVLSVSFALPVKTTNETVEVTGELPLIEPDKTDVSEVVSLNAASNLPLNGRRWNNFALLTPGVSTDGGNGLISYRGISGLYNNSSVDGVSNQQAFFSEARGRTSVAYTFSLDAIREFEVSSSNYSAEFGQAAGGNINAVTKAGTNELHGDAFYFLRYPSLNALDPFSKTRGIFNQTEHQRQQFGGSVGGPIYRDKLFFFLNYDGQRRVFPILYTGPSSSGAITALQNPFICNAGGLSTGALIVGPEQCQAALDFVNGTVGSYPRNANQDIYLAKLDYQLNSRNRLNVLFNFMDFKAPNDYVTSATVSAGSILQNGSFGTHDRYVVANWDSTITNSLINSFRFQWSRDFQFYGANFSGPSVSLSQFTGYGLPNALPRPAFPDEHRLQFADNVSWTHGKHNIKTGVDISPIHELLVNLFQGGGIYSYSGATPTATFQNWLADVYGVPLPGSSKPLGENYTTFTQVTDPITGVGKDDFYNVDYAFFVEDTWRVRPTLTLNLGLRYDLQWVPQPNRPNTLGTLLPLYTSTINIDKNNFGPRIGIAWQPKKDTVVRLGYGLFYGKTTNSTYYATRVENGVYQQTFQCVPGNDTTGVCAPAFPNVIFPAPGPALAAPFDGALTPQVVAAVALPNASQVGRGQTPDFVNPIVHQGELSVEHQLPGSISVSATYLFSRALRLPVFVDTNLAPATTTATYDILNSPVGGPTSITVPFYTQRADTQTGVINAGLSTVNAWYNALVIEGKKRFSHGFEFLASYTFSKAIDDGQVPGTFGTFNGTDVTLDPLNQTAENSVSDLDQRHRFVASTVWQPAFHIENRFTRHLVNDFTFAGIVTVASPQPVTAFMSTFVPSGAPDGGATGGETSNGNANGGRAPQFGRNTFYGPTQIRTVDFRIARDFPIYHERVKLQLIGEAFNLFNHTLITSVNTTAFAFANPGAPGSGCPASDPGAPIKGCLVGQTSFLAPTASSNALLGARQLQVSAKITF